MATKTLGTNATTTLTALSFQRGGLAAADIATIQQDILNDLVNGNPIWPGAFSSMGLLYVPNRGILQVLPGDYVGVDATGWPILVSANAIASGSTSWTHN
jgi:hypothetical protein